MWSKVILLLISLWNSVWNYDHFSDGDHYYLILDLIDFDVIAGGINAVKPNKQIMMPNKKTMKPDQLSQNDSILDDTVFI